MAYYKTNLPEILNPLKDFQAKQSDLIVESEKFAELFRNENQKAKPLYSNSLGRFHFAGLVFSPVQKNDLWTLPDKQGGHQWPKAALRKATPEQKKQHKELVEKYKSKPKAMIRNDDFFDSIGISIGNLFFSSLTRFVYQDFVYIETDMKLKDGIEEILGSEYSTAKQLFDSVKNG